MPAPFELVQHCPRCGALHPGPHGQIPFHCEPCSLTLFFNPTVAGAVFLFDPTDRVLFIRRAKEPAQGKLAVPGGFIDFGESAEAGLRREVREEVGVDVTELTYLSSCPNRYEYRGVTYFVCDLIFTGRVLQPERATPLDAVAGIEWRALTDVNPEEFAFPSVRLGWEHLVRRN